MVTDLLGDEQRAALAPYARAWVDRALGTDPVNWDQWQSGARRCYTVLGLRFPDAVVRTPSPLAMARMLFAAGIDETPGDEDRAIVGVMRERIFARVDRMLEKLFGRVAVAQVRRGVFAPIDAAMAADSIALAVADALRARPAMHAWDGQQNAPGIPRAVARTRHGKRVYDDWQSWRLHLGGHWESAWNAYTTFLGAAIPDGSHQALRRRVRGIADAQVAGWWWPHLDFVIVSDRPTAVHTEEIDGARRLHRSDGPAIVWSDGWALHFWHGTRVPAWVIDAPTIPAIHAEPNVEVRRCAIEVIGWDAYIAGAGLHLVDTADDPGNPGFQLRLYDMPGRVWGEPARVLLATNGSPERDGTRRRYGLPVPADMDTAVHAAAWTYGLSHHQYAGLARRT